MGAGIQIAPNATRILHRLGLAGPLARVGVRPEGTDIRRWDDGRALWREPLGQAVVERFGAPYYHLYRPDLLALLAEALPSGTVHLGRRVTGYAQA